MVKGHKHSEETKEKMRKASHHIGHPHSEETKRKLRKPHFGNSSWRKGIPMTEKQKAILLATHLGKKTPKEVRDKISKANTGKKRTEETKKKMGAWQIGRRRPKETIEKISGKNNWNWKGGKSSENHKIRHSIEYKLWRDAVFARDGYTCQKTGVRGGKLHPHHILNFCKYPELRTSIENGITLSEKSHKEFHKIYGNRNNNQEQLIEFLKC